MGSWRADAGYLALIERYGASLKHLAILLTGNSHDAEDIVQDAVVAVAGQPRRAHTAAYLRKTVSNRAMDLLRKRQEIPSETIPETAYEDSDFFRFERQQRFLALVNTLPTGQRATLILRYYADLDDSDIASILGVTVETVRSQAHRGLEKLRASDLVTREDQA